MKVHPFIEAEKVTGKGVERACRLLEVSRSAFYAHRNSPSERTVTDATLTAEIRSIHSTSKGTYGSPRVHAELAARRSRIGRRRVTRLMREAAIVGRHKRRWRKTTVVDPDAERARDLIQRDFAPGPTTNRRYVGDITYISTWEGFAYLATVIDLSSRRVVGWALANQPSHPLNSQLVEQFELKNRHRAASECLVSLDQHQPDFR
jgi:transposase InsO family protein